MTNQEQVNSDQFNFCGTCGETGHYAGDTTHFCGRPKNIHPGFLNPAAETVNSDVGVEPPPNEFGRVSCRCGESVLPQNWANHLMRQTRRPHGSVRLTVARAWGEDAQSVDLVAALEEHNIYSRGDLDRALVNARGSLDAAALREMLIPLATRYTDHLTHPEAHPAIREQEPTDNCWIDLYRAIVGLDSPAKVSATEPPFDNGSAEQHDGAVVEPRSAAVSSTGDGLREAFERTSHPEGDESGIDWTCAGELDYLITRLRAALQNTGEGLDVERLARAMWEVRAGGSLDNRDAAQIAAEYDRLAALQSEPQSEEASR